MEFTRQHNRPAVHTPRTHAHTHQRRPESTQGGRQGGRRAWGGARTLQPATPPVTLRRCRCPRCRCQSPPLPAPRPGQISPPPPPHHHHPRCQRPPRRAQQRPPPRPPHLPPRQPALLQSQTPRPRALRGCEAVGRASQQAGAWVVCGGATLPRRPLGLETHVPAQAPARPHHAPPPSCSPSSSSASLSPSKYEGLSPRDKRPAPLSTPSTRATTAVGGWVGGRLVWYDARVRVALGRAQGRAGCAQGDHMHARTHHPPGSTHAGPG